MVTFSLKDLVGISNIIKQQCFEVSLNKEEITHLVYSPRFLNEHLCISVIPLSCSFRISYRGIVP